MMIFYNLLGSVLHNVVTYAVIISMLSSSIPIIRELPRATAAYLGMMQQLGLLKSDPTSPAGVSPSVPEEIKSKKCQTWPSNSNAGRKVI
ncbi:MAG: hypothetical protein GY845_00255 [Planctomycetes bacterium]|nr:hypothetical protein [Planctomycetota bacterium]